MSGVVDACAIARELNDAYARSTTISIPPSARVPGFDLDAGYAVESELVRMRRDRGRVTVGRKVGYANRAVWRALKLETLVWAHMYDDTVHYASGNSASLSVATMCAPKIEPEIVLKMQSEVAADAGPADVLGAVEWIALGFEIVHCVYADWKFQPADFVAAYGLHGALVVGQPRAVEAAAIPSLAEQLSQFTIRLLEGDRLAAEGGGKNVLRSPVLCVGELAAASARRAGAALAPGELVSSGSLTEAQLLAPGQTWSAVVAGIDLPSLTLHT
jgi:2-keto-4-pentenoate hydratase